MASVNDLPQECGAYSVDEVGSEDTAGQEVDGVGGTGFLVEIVQGALIAADGTGLIGGGGIGVGL